MDHEQKINLTADIVMAFVSHNAVQPFTLPSLILSVHDIIDSLATPKQAPTAEARPEPAVSARASVKPDAVTCMECGFKGKMLKRHLKTHHGLTPDEYRTRWNLAADHPLVAPNYAEVRRNLAVKIGLGRKAG